MTDQQYPLPTPRPTQITVCPACYHRGYVARPTSGQTTGPTSGVCASCNGWGVMQSSYHIANTLEVARAFA